MKKHEYILEFLSENAENKVVDMTVYEAAGKLDVNPIYLYRIATDHGYCFRLKRDAKENVLIEKMREISENGVIPCNRLEFIKEYGGCYKTINRIAQKEGLTFKDSCRSKRYKKSMRTEQNVKKIKDMYSLSITNRQQMGTISTTLLGE